MLIVFEGIDKSGKTTQAKKAVSFIRKHKKKVSFYKYPNKKGLLGDILSKFLKEKIDLSPTAQFLLFIADMAMDQEKIFKDLSSGKVVVCDRYFLSTLAYQRFPYEKGVEIIKRINFLRPDLIIYLDISPETAMKRQNKIKKSKERYEKNVERLLLARTKYRAMAEENLFGKWIVIDGNKSEEEVTSEVLKNIENLLR
ncbi:MAG: dTMP kinase [Candidatus Micrarchaeia archaeon]